MSQTDLNVANGTGAAIRADINAHLDALVSLSSGATAPPTTFPNQWWYDTSVGQLKRRNNANTTWLASFSDIVQYQDQPASGANSPAYASGGWRTVTISAKVKDPGSIGTLSSNQMTLAAGSYDFYGMMVLGSPAANGVARLRLRNITGGATIQQGPNRTAQSSVATVMHVQGQFINSSSVTFELQVYPAQTINAGGALTSGDLEVYADVYFRRHSK